MKPTVSVIVIVITLIASLGAAADLVIENHPDGKVDRIESRFVPFGRENSSEIPIFSDDFETGDTINWGDFPYSGKLTYYGGNPAGGACGYNMPVDYASTSYVDYYVAAGADVFKDGNNCGMAIEITNAERYDPNNHSCLTRPNTTIRVILADRCPECPNDHLDLAPVPMEALVEPGLAGTCGILSADWRFASARLTSNIQIQSKSGVSAYWYGLRPFSHNLPIRQVELRSSGSADWYEALKNQGPSFYTLTGGYPLTLPLSIRLTDVNNNQVVATDVITSFDSEAYFDTGVQFSGELTGDPLQ